MKVRSVFSPRYSNGEGTVITCSVQFEGLPAPVPFSASAADPAAYGAALFQALTAGQYGPVQEFMVN
jgi:hypothetical protein